MAKLPRSTGSSKTKAKVIYNQRFVSPYLSSPLVGSRPGNVCRLLQFCRHGGSSLTGGPFCSLSLREYLQFTNLHDASYPLQTAHTTENVPQTVCLTSERYYES